MPASNPKGKVLLSSSCLYLVPQSFSGRQISFKGDNKENMRYFDTGGRDPAQTLASWIEGAVRDQVAEIRVQTGFFSLDGIGLLIPTLEQCRFNDQTTKVLIGSNDASTLRDDVAGLMEIIGIPRNHAQLGVVNFSGAYFHPKTYHIQRADGSQAAFVGSANLTTSGLTLHVEAGIALDTNEGDDPSHLSEIATAIDRWFEEQRDGLTVISDTATLDAMVGDGILALAPPPRANNQGAEARSANGSARPRLRPLYALPPVRTAVAQPVTQVGQAPTPPVATHIPAQPNAAPATNLLSVPRGGFPPYLLFAPNAAAPTVSTSALTGTLLPGGSVGLIVQLNRDSARHFMGRDGTANISIPVATVSTLRFGIYGKHDRPRAEFTLRLRYVSDGGLIDGGTTSTNVMGYGFTADETGHGDIRMLVPTEVRSLSQAVIASGLTPPIAGDIALLEWPTARDPSFRLSFLDTHSAISQQAITLFNAAAAAGQVVGNGACWLAAGVSPNW